MKSTFERLESHVRRYALARAVRADGNQIPIIALTAHAMSEDRQNSLNFGCDDYASKPIDRASLLSTCQRWLSAVERNPVEETVAPCGS
jgi:CheY-like chemotaxis protein